MGWLLSDEEAKTVRSLSDKLESAVKALFGSAAGELGGWAGEAIGSKRDLWRLKNRLDTMQKAQKLLADYGVDVSAADIPLRQSIPLIEAIGDEDDATIQRLWAELIANAVDPHRRQQINRVFIHILRSIDPIEAAILEWLKPLLLAADTSKQGEEASLEELLSHLKVGQSELKISLYHLASLGCFRYSNSANVTFGLTGPWPYLTVDEVEFRPTDLAVSLIQACSIDIDKTKKTTP